MKSNLRLRPLLLPLLFILTLVSSTSCQKTLDSETQWKMENERIFASYADSTNFFKASTEGSNAFIYMKSRKVGAGTEFAIETSRVLIHYETYFLAGNKAFIEGNFDSEAPEMFALSRGGDEDLITGVRIGLQNMKQGDEAELIIPWNLAYGDAKHDILEAYTALRYIVRLDSIIPESIP